MSTRGYQEKIKRLQDQLRALPSQESLSLYKRTSNLFRSHTQDTRAHLDVSTLNQVLNIDKKSKTAEIEGMITFDALVKKTLAKKLLPAVVPELKSITVGGAYVGGGIESSSFRYGLVHEMVEEVDVLLGNGDLITATATNEHRDLFFGLPNSYGTLGYVTRLKIKLITAQSYVNIHHYHYHNSQDVWKKIAEFVEKDFVDYLEAVVFSRDKIVISTAKFTGQASKTSNYHFMKIYYRSLLQRCDDSLTSSDYIWRWDTDWFWCSKHYHMQNPVLRFLFGKFLLKSTRYWKLRHAVIAHPWLQRLLFPFNPRTESIIQDVQIPLNRCEEFLNFFSTEIGILPVWLCPCVPTEKAQSYTLYPMKPGEIYINFGFWDSIPSNKPAGYYNRLIEEKVAELQGFKGLYSDCYYTEAEFWRLHDKPNYDRLKDRYDPNRRFKNLFEKIKS